jgi:hypothetical protein
MTPIKQLLAGLVAAVMLSTPAVAYKSGLVKRPLGGPVRARSLLAAILTPVLTFRQHRAAAHLLRRPTAKIAMSAMTHLYAA